MAVMLKKLNALLDKKQKLQIGLLMAMILLGGLLETLGVSLIMPLGAAITDEAGFFEEEYVQWFCAMTGIGDRKTLIILLLFALVCVYVGKNLFLLLLCYVQAKFVNNNRCRVSGSLLSQYLHRPYAYYLYADSASILRTIYGDMDNVFNLLLQCMNLAAEAAVSLCLAGVLLIVDARMMCVMAVIFGAVTVLISKVIKPRLKDVGESSRQEQSNLYKWILQSVSGIKEVKVLHKEYYFVDSYMDCAVKYARYQVKNNVFANVPKLLIESVALGGVLLYIAARIMAGTPLASMVTMLMAFAAAAMRLLPSVNRINTYLANIAYYQPALDFIYETVDMKQIREQAAFDKKNRNACAGRKIALEREVRLEHITFCYPNTDKNIFQDAHMCIPAGKSIGIMGASGAGKTTIVDVLLGLLTLQEGKITADGVDIFENYADWLSHIGYIPQTIYMLDDSIRHNIAFGVREEEINEERLWEVLEEAQMKTFVEGLPEGLDTQIGERGVRISGGQRQRLGIARALYHDPQLLIFDEATSALDTDTETAIMEAIDKLHGQKTMLIIAHRLRTIENCDMIYEVKDGKIQLHA